jgi:hypothetical protein
MQVPAQAPAAPIAFDIPSQPMAAALNAWAVQANAQVFVDPGPVAHLTAPAVKGTLTPRTLSFAVPATPYRTGARLQSTALALKYYFAPEARLDPFLGAGVEVATLYDAGSVTGLDRVTAGPSVAAGVDVLLDVHWMINAGVSWAQVRPAIDPVQFGLGFVYRFGASGD